MPTSPISRRNGSALAQAGQGPPRAPVLDPTKALSRRGRRQNQSRLPPVSRSAGRFICAVNQQVTVDRTATMKDYETAEPKNNDFPVCVRAANVSRHPFEGHRR